MNREQRREWKENDTNFKLWENLRLQVLEYIKKRMPGRLQSEKHRGTFYCMDFTSQKALKHIEDNAHFKLSALTAYEDLQVDLKSPYCPKNGPELYFENLILTQTKISSLGTKADGSAKYSIPDSDLITKAQQAFRAVYGNFALQLAMSGWATKDARLEQQADYDNILFKEFRTYWCSDLTKLKQMNLPAQANLAEMAEEQDLAAARLNKQERQIAALQAELAEARKVLMEKVPTVKTDDTTRSGSSINIRDDASLVSAITTAVTDKLNIKQELQQAMQAAGIKCDVVPDKKNKWDTLYWKRIRGLNDGKDCKFDKYCFKHGVSCTHSSFKCKALSDDEKIKYKDVTADDTMGGSTKWMERNGMYESAFHEDWWRGWSNKVAKSVAASVNKYVINNIIEQLDSTQHACSSKFTPNRHKPPVTHTHTFPTWA